MSAGVWCGAGRGSPGTLLVVMGPGSRRGAGPGVPAGRGSRPGPACPAGRGYGGGGGDDVGPSSAQVSMTWARWPSSGCRWNGFW